METGITVEQLKEKLAGLKSAHRDSERIVYLYDGAIQFCERLIGELEGRAENTDPPSNRAREAEDIEAQE